MTIDKNHQNTCSPLLLFLLNNIGIIKVGRYFLMTEDNFGSIVLGGGLDEQMIFGLTRGAMETRKMAVHC
jgi:hypothetical protein